MESVDDRVMRQAGDTADLWLGSAIRSIDGYFGSGYAKDHPELIAAFLNAAASDGKTYALIAHFESALRDLAESIRDLRSK